jgi:hypothetical protein
VPVVEIRYLWLEGVLQGFNVVISCMFPIYSACGMLLMNSNIERTYSNVIGKY